MKLKLAILFCFLSVMAWAQPPFLRTPYTTGTVAQADARAVAAVVSAAPFATPEQLAASALTNAEPIPPKSYLAATTRVVGQDTNQIAAFFGDSWIGSMHPEFTSLKKLQYGDGGDGFFTIATNGYPFASYSSTDMRRGMLLLSNWTFSTVGTGPNMGEASTTVTNASVTFTSVVTRFNVIFKQRPGGGTFRISTNGVAWVTNNTHGTSTNWLATNTPALPLALHTLTLTILDPSTNGVTLAGVDLQNHGYGIRVHHLGFPGSTSTNFAPLVTSGMNSNLHYQAMRLLNPRTIFHALGGVNDKSHGNTVVSYSNTIRGLRMLYTNALPYSDLVFLSEAETSVAGSPTVRDYMNAQRDIALRNNHRFINNYWLFGDFATATNLNLWSQGEIEAAVPVIHPSTEGYMQMNRNLILNLGDGGVNWGNFRVLTLFNHYANNKYIDLGGDTQVVWIKSDESSPLQLRVANVTNLIAEINGTLTVPNYFSSPIGINTPSKQGTLNIGTANGNTGLNMINGSGGEYVHVYPGGGGSGVIDILDSTGTVKIHLNSGAGSSFNTNGATGTAANFHGTMYWNGGETNDSPISFLARMPNGRVVETAVPTGDSGSGASAIAVWTNNAAGGTNVQVLEFIDSPTVTVGGTSNATGRIKITAEVVPVYSTNWDGARFMLTNLSVLDAEKLLVDNAAHTSLASSRTNDWLYAEKTNRQAGALWLQSYANANRASTARSYYELVVDTTNTVQETRVLNNTLSSVGMTYYNALTHAGWAESHSRNAGGYDWVISTEIGGQRLAFMTNWFLVTNGNVYFGGALASASADIPGTANIGTANITNASFDQMSIGRATFTNRFQLQFTNAIYSAGSNYVVDYAAGGVQWIFPTNRNIVILQDTNRATNYDTNSTVSLLIDLRLTAPDSVLWMPVWWLGNGQTNGAPLTSNKVHRLVVNNYGPSTNNTDAAYWRR